MALHGAGRWQVLVILAAAAWIAEGLLIYLTAEQNEALITQISDASPPGKVLFAVEVEESRPQTPAARLGSPARNVTGR